MWGHTWGDSSEKQSMADIHAIYEDQWMDVVPTKKQNNNNDDCIIFLENSFFLIAQL